MKINKLKFLKALDTVKPGLSNKEQIEQSSSYCFKGNRVITYNDEVSVSCPIEDFDIEGVVNSEELYSLVSKIKNEEIEINLEDNQLLFKAGKMKAGLTVHSEIVLPIDEIGEITKWKKLPENFVVGLNFVMGSCSRNMSDPILSCVHVNKGSLEGTDNYRVSHFKLAEEIKTKSFLIPANSCVKIIRLFPQEIAQTSGWVHFKNDDGAVISSRVFEEKFPDTTPILEKEKGKKLTFPKDTLDILTKAGIFSKRDTILNESVEVKIAKGRLSIRSENEAGWFEEKSKVDYKGDEFSFSIPPYLLKDILGEINACVISENKLLFENDAWVYVSVLM